MRIDRSTQTLQDASAPDPGVSRGDQRAKDRQDRQEQSDKLRRETLSKKEMDVRQQNDGDDEAARELVAAKPNAAQRDLVADLKKLRACGTPRALDALKRVKSG